MLELLRIRNLALIDEIEVEFGSGLNVLTGETGAGKSIVVGALNLVLGARASSEVVRTGENKAEVDAVFRIKKCSPKLQELLNEHGIEPEDDALLLSRSIWSDGRSRAFISGRPVTLAVLSAFGDELVDFHGQHEHQSLLRPELQLELLDRFAQAETELANVQTYVQRLKDLDRKIQEFEAEDREKERRLEFLRFECNEIFNANLRPGEEDELRQRRNFLTNMEKIAKLSSQVYAALYESQGSAAVDQLSVAERALRELVLFDSSFQEMLKELEVIRESVSDIASRVRRFTGEVDFDPAELNSLNERLALINDLKRKYGSTIEEILEYARTAAEQIQAYEKRDEIISEMKKEREAVLEKALAEAAMLSGKRRKAADYLDSEVTAMLGSLGITHGSFFTRFENVELGTRGTERIEFMFSANVGEEPRSLRAVASGGEISRVMLAIKSILATADCVPTLVFDEIDAGVGGATAHKVAARLLKLAETHQVLCITHLPAIAAFAHKHFLVTKEVQDARTTTGLKTVVGEERVREIARLLDGTGSPVSLEHARSLMEAASRRGTLSDADSSHESTVLIKEKKPRLPSKK